MPDSPLTILRSDPASRPAREVLEDLGVSRERGLEPEDARRRFQQHGPNVLQARRPRRWPEMVLDQLTSPATALLAETAILSFGLGEDAGGFVRPPRPPDGPS